MLNIKSLERNFDLVRYLKDLDPNAHEYPPNIAVKCPTCDGVNKLWVLTVDKASGPKAGSFICYKCEDRGTSVLDLVQRLSGVSRFDAVGILIGNQGDAAPLTDLRDTVIKTLHGLYKLDETWDQEELPCIELPREFIRAADRDVWPTYFKMRGIKRLRAVIHDLGWCEEGYFKKRLVVPVVFNKKQTFFVARYMRPKPPEGVKKTIYPKGSKVQRVLFNYDQARYKKRIVVVEDVFSAMHVGSNAVATFGTSLSQYQLELLLHSDASEIVLMWDNDAIDKAKKLALRLAEFFKVRVVELPDARDPDEFSRADLRTMIGGAPTLDRRAALAGHVRATLART